MTVMDVDPQTYYSTATRLQEAAINWFSAIDGRFGALSNCSSMAGSYTEAREWADAYDNGAAELLRQTTLIAEAAGNFATVLQTVGYNYAVADFTATINAGGPGPEKPASFPPAVYLCRVPLPSSGGPGNGLVSDSVELIEKIGVTVPDGDTDKLQAVADAWKQIQSDPAVTGFSDAIDQIAKEIGQNTAPEISLIVQNLNTLRDSANDAIAAFGEFSTACLDHKADLRELRDKLVVLLQDLGKQIAAEVGITIALAVAASVVTAGLGAALGAARVIQIIARCSAPIRVLVDGWKIRTEGQAVQRQPARRPGAEGERATAAQADGPAGDSADAPCVPLARRGGRDRRLLRLGSPVRESPIAGRAAPHPGTAALRRHTQFRVGQTAQPPRPGHPHYQCGARRAQQVLRGIQQKRKCHRGRIH
ncbi:hypothetical protein [Nocardia gipuzkoensis]|uniref:hypothetical protein n=1 Tax=Nocardia gipuzkoensis TaxID=2749991 RepID=UPI00237E7F34|nr:hypothetical protein [Nocardia gipuzkoensis]MDE1670155.1 hypothetical protein [Nocardia gipuzkoensis]